MKNRYEVRVPIGEKFSTCVYSTDDRQDAERWGELNLTETNKWWINLIETTRVHTRFNSHMESRR